ncbi:MAG: hypothetical protein GC164_12530 [Phycisphaera sp.]|nr:hypothetical protein [Phycisphaera sp.]
MPIDIREIGEQDLERALELWQATGDMSAAMIDSAQGLANFLKVNKGLSLVAVENDSVVAVLLCGHEGGKGQLYQLAVDAGHTDPHTSRRLLDKALHKLRAKGYHRLRLKPADPASPDNHHALWGRIAWGTRPTVVPPPQPCETPSYESLDPQAA